MTPQQLEDALRKTA